MNMNEHRACPCPCGCTDIQRHMSYPLKETDPPKTAVELRWCPSCGRATATVGQRHETYEELAARANLEWSAALQAAVAPTEALSRLSPVERRVLAAILLLGAERAIEQALAVATGFGPTHLVLAIRRMESLGIITRTRSTRHGVDLPSGWWPRPPFHGMLAVFLEMIEFAPTLDERLKESGMPTTQQPERIPA